MRQDYIRVMTDPVGRATYIEADTADRWAPKMTRSFEHSPDVAAAWNALVDAVHSDGSGTHLDGTDDAIAAHLTATLPALTDHAGSSIHANSRELTFGPAWSADEVASLVASDIIPDETLRAALDTARTSPDTLEAIRNAARQYDAADREQHASTFEDGHAGQVHGDEQQLRVAGAFYRQENDAYPAHVSIELSVNREYNPAASARSDSVHDVIGADGTLQVEMSIHNVATRHLQELSGTTARIDDSGYTVNINMNLPTAPAPTGSDTVTAAPSGSRPSLTAEQHALLPSLTHAIGGCLPADEQHHARVLAQAVAREVPTAADAIAAYDKVTVAEVIEHHEQRMETYTMTLTPEPAPAARTETPGAAVPAPGTITYEPDEGFGGMLTIKIPVTPPAPRAHLLAAATAQRPHAALSIGYCLDKAATGHLQNATGTAAAITNNGQQTLAYVVLPKPVSEHAPMYGETHPYIDSERRALTPEQEAALPGMVETISDIVPSKLAPHVHDIAHLAAQEITTQADVLRAYQRTSVPEVLTAHDRFGEPDPLPPELQHLVKTARLSFPQPASEAHTKPPSAVPASPVRAAAGTHASRGFGR